MNQHKAAKAMHGISSDIPKGFLPFTLREAYHAPLIEEELVLDVMDDIVDDIRRIKDSALRMDIIVTVMLFEYLGQFLFLDDGTSILEDSDKEYLIRNIREMYDRVEDALVNNADIITNEGSEGPYDEPDDEGDDLSEDESDEGYVEEDDEFDEDGDNGNEPDIEISLPRTSFIVSLVLQDDEISKYIARMVKDAYGRGFTDGYDRGYDEGYGDVTDDSYTKGYDLGYNDGRSDAVDGIIEDLMQSDEVEIVDDTDDDIQDPDAIDQDHGFGCHPYDDYCYRYHEGQDPCDECSGSCCARCLKGAVCFDMMPMRNEGSRNGGA